MGKFIDHTGETNITNNGMKITIINYRKNKDIDIQFEDSIIVYNKTYRNFKKGLIKHPNINMHTVKTVTKHTGETRTMNCGMKATIIKYHNYKNIDVQFENGIIAYNKQYDSFKKGKIAKPTIKRIGETNIANNGMKMTIITYKKANNINIQFENNVIVYNKTYDTFKKGLIKHPNVINNIRLKEFAYKLNNDWYYICSHPTWIEDKILSVKEIYAYKSS